jgi:hypothetical protein
LGSSPVDFVVLVKPQNSSGVHSIAVYNVSGKLVRTVASDKTVINLEKDFGISRGVYVIRIGSSQ